MNSACALRGVLIGAFLSWAPALVPAADSGPGYVAASQALTRSIPLEKHYLNIPVKNGAAMRIVQLKVDGKPVREFHMELADGKPDFWTYLDVSEWKGHAGLLQVRPVPADYQGLEQVEQSDTLKDADDLYHEKLRPQFHFTAKRGWINDPNGLIFYKGEWHMFFQSNPYGWEWENMHWGHAISSDLVHWKQLPIALYPSDAGYCYSGACFLDTKNLLGLKTGADDVMVAFYLRTNIGIGYSYSNDRGRSWTDYAGNPLVKPRFGRVDSPKPFWHAPSNRWVAAVYDHEKFGPNQPGDTVAIYTSADLKSWKLESNVGPVGLNAECPDLFELPLDGKADHPLWVLVFGNSQYIVGHFDGKKMTNLAGEAATVKDYQRSVVGYNSYMGHNHFGTPYYATQTFSNVPAEDGRRIQMAWMRGSDLAGMPFNQQMSLPSELSLRTTEKGPALFYKPIRELDSLTAKPHVWKDVALKPGENLLKGLEGDLFRIRAEIEPGTAKQVGFMLRGYGVVYDVAKQKMMDQSLPLVDGRVKFDIFLDRNTVDAFINDGRLYSPTFTYFPEKNHSLQTVIDGSEAKIISLEVDELKSIWEEGK